MHIAVIGDIHGFWDAADTRYFNASDYDALLFVGDLPRLTGGLDVAGELAQLTKPAWMIPGNHDGCSTLQLLAEIKGWSTLCRLGARRMPARVARLDKALGPVQLGGFSSAALDEDLGLIVARPHAMGPDRFYYRRYLQTAHGIADFEASAARLRALVDSAPQRLVFLAHNGPAGLGDSADAIWGCDFSEDFGDFGDPDLRNAIDYATATGRQVLAVVAGHMHLRSKGGGRRQPLYHGGDTVYVNAAEVARIRRGGTRRHHVCLAIDARGARAEHRWVDADGQPVAAPDDPDGQ